MLVTGIQQRRVGDAGDSFHAKDFAWLDSCDEHRNEGEGSVALTLKYRHLQKDHTHARRQSRPGRQALARCAS
ncbi:hypothetical protein EFQ99_02955 [Rhizobium vallis]|uniref:Uncharacterized protein n=1 Tax=Rhizobium vallis TaxID=634290 RepID=A0A3S0QYE0_9HYPH|nr:hypothetical protein EFQ99_02955 [Rhizobium vallis]